LEPKNLKNQQRDWVTEVLANFSSKICTVFLSFNQNLVKFSSVENLSD